MNASSFRKNIFLSVYPARFGVFLLVLASFPFTIINDATASSLVYQQTSSGNFINPATLSPVYRISNIEVTVASDNPDLLVTKVNFTGNLVADAFVPSSSNPLLRIKIFKKWMKGNQIEGGFGDIWIDNPKERYPYQNIQIPASVSSTRSVGASETNSRLDLSGCAAKSWIDPSGQNSWLKFSVSMSCIRLPDKFAITAFVDSDINSNFQPDSKFAPSIPMEIDLTGISRPKPKDEQFLKLATPPTIDLRTPSIQVSAAVDRVSLEGQILAGLPIIYQSISPSVCAFQNQSINTLSVLKSGNCIISAFSPGNAVVSDSNRSQVQFIVNPKPMVSQEIYWNEPDGVSELDGDISLGLSSSSGLPVTATSSTPKVCFFKDPFGSPSVISILSSGTCQLTVSQSGNDEFFPKDGYASFFVAPKPVVEKPTPPKGTTPSTPRPPRLLGGGELSTETQEKLVLRDGGAKTNSKASKKESTIFCKKGSITRKVTAINPKCQSGYKKV